MDYETALEIKIAINGVEEAIGSILDESPTLRTRIAIAAMQGLLANPGIKLQPGVGPGNDMVSFWAVHQADSLLAALSAQEKPHAG